MIYSVVVLSPVNLGTPEMLCPEIMKNSYIVTRAFVLAFAFFTLLPSELSAQNVLTLDQCIQKAMSNNIGLARAQNNALIAKSNKFQAYMAFLPSLEARMNYDFFTGNFFDTNAGRQFSATTRTSNPNLRSNLTLFNGFANHYSMKSNKSAEEAAINAVEEQKQTVRSTVLGSYLDVVLAKENIRISNDRIALLEAQLEREKKRESIGVGNLEQVYNFRSQVANEKLNLVNLNNTLQSNKLALLQILQLDGSESFDIEPYDFSDDEILLTAEPFSGILSRSLEYAPGLKRAAANSESARFGYKRTRSAMFPTITAFGLYGSNYSSNGALNPESGLFESDATFFNQLEFNKFEFFNFQLNIPIFNNWSNRNAAQVSKLTMYNAELDLKQTQVDIINTIQRVYLDLVAAQETYKAAQENLIALNQSYDFVNSRYQNGNTDFFAYLESLNNKNAAEIGLINAKYSIIFRKKILDVFMGLK